jgi:hypothetical protein
MIYILFYSFSGDKVRHKNANHINKLAKIEQSHGNLDQFIAIHPEPPHSADCTTSKLMLNEAQKG